MKTDPGPTHKFTVHFAKGTQTATPSVEPWHAEYPARRAAAERLLTVDAYEVPASRGETALTIKTLGWYPASVTLNAKQARWLRDLLTQRFPDPT